MGEFFNVFFFFQLPGNDDNSGDENKQDMDDVAERRRSSSDPVNLSLGYRERDDDSNDGHIDVETIGNAPSKPVSLSLTFLSSWNYCFSKKISTKKNISAFD